MLLKELIFFIFIYNILRSRLHLNLCQNASVSSYFAHFVGFGMCVCYLGAFVTVGWIFHSGAGTPLVLLTVGIALGQIIFPYVYDALITEYGWSGTFLILGAITLHCVPVGLLFWTSRQYFKVGNNPRAKKTRTFDVSLFKDPVVVLFLINALLFSTTGKRLYEPRHDKTNKVSVRPAKTRISRGIRPV